jgi:hypothetical protein
MFLKAFALLAPVVAGGLWVSGLFAGGAYSRVVDRPPAEVLAALEDLDVRKQPGQPGTDPSASGGVAQVFVSEHVPDGIAFVVMSGDKVATRMTAHLEPLEGGKRTRVTATVERGDAPDDFVAPAFRSKGVTLTLFSAALEGELNDLVAPPRLSQEQCQELEQRLLLANAPTNDPKNFVQAVGGTARTVIALGAVEAELRRRGCATTSPGAGGEFKMPENRMGQAGSGGATMPVDPGVHFEPGKPMVDPTQPAH